ncbi:hypothetical protein [Streptomyces sp. NPDC052127]|uniref:hypothetical protein n=1 Tax=Streptomyces sp. NPDC052127 TaxID=3155679 RepID=UPI00341CDAC8
MAALTVGMAGEPGDVASAELFPGVLRQFGGPWKDLKCLYGLQAAYRKVQGPDLSPPWRSAAGGPFLQVAYMKFLTKDPFVISLGQVI